MIKRLIKLLVHQGHHILMAYFIYRLLAWIYLIIKIKVI